MHPYATILEKQLAELFAPVLESEGLELVRIRLIGGDRRSCLQLMLDRIDGEGVTLDACADVSRSLSALLEVNDPLSGAYILEVGSAGMDRPLTKPEHFSRYIGREIKLELSQPVDGCRRFRARLISADANGIVFSERSEEYQVPFAQIAEARLVPDLPVDNKPKHKSKPGPKARASA